jgi:hypothetical protein
MITLAEALTAHDLARLTTAVEAMPRCDTCGGRIPGLLHDRHERYLARAEAVER